MNVATLSSHMGKVETQFELKHKDSDIKPKCTGCCRCCGCLNIVKNVSLNNGITTITLQNGALSNLKNRPICVGMFSSIPTGVSGSKVQVTDGNKTLFVYNNGSCPSRPCNQYWRPIKFIRNSVMIFKYLDDPEVLVFQRVIF